MDPAMKEISRLRCPAHSQEPKRKPTSKGPSALVRSQATLPEAAGRDMREAGLQETGW